MDLSARASAPPASAASNPPPRTRLAAAEPAAAPAPFSFAARPLGVNRPARMVARSRSTYALTVSSAGRSTPERYNNAAAASRVVSGSGPNAASITPPRRPRSPSTTLRPRSSAARSTRGANPCAANARRRRGSAASATSVAADATRPAAGWSGANPPSAYCASSTSASASPETAVAAANRPRRGEGLPSPIAAARAAPGECAGERTETEAETDAVGGERTAGEREGDRDADAVGARLAHSGLGAAAAAAAASAPVVVGNAPQKTPKDVGGGDEGVGSGSIASGAIAGSASIASASAAFAGSSGSSSSSSSPREYASTSAKVTRRRLDGVAPNGSGVVSPGAGMNARAAPNAPSPGDLVDRDAPARGDRRDEPGDRRAGDRADGRGASSSSGPTVASREASKSKGSGFFGTPFGRSGASAGTSGGSGAATSASAARAEAPAETSDPAPPRRVTRRVGAGAGDGAGSEGGEGFSALTGTPDCLRPLPLRSYILDRKPMAAAGEVARGTTSRRFQTPGRNDARDATTNPPRRGSQGGRATSARARLRRSRALAPVSSLRRSPTRDAL